MQEAHFQGSEGASKEAVHRMWLKEQHEKNQPKDLQKTLNGSKMPVLYRRDRLLGEGVWQAER